MTPLDLEFLNECLKARIITSEEYEEAIEQDVTIYCDTTADNNINGD